MQHLAQLKHRNDSGSLTTQQEDQQVGKVNDEKIDFLKDDNSELKDDKKSDDEMRKTFKEASLALDDLIEDI